MSNQVESTKPIHEYRIEFKNKNSRYFDVIRRLEHAEYIINENIKAVKPPVIFAPNQEEPTFIAAMEGVMVAASYDDSIISVRKMINYLRGKSLPHLVFDRIEYDEGNDRLYAVVTTTDNIGDRYLPNSGLLLFTYPDDNGIGEWVKNNNLTETDSVWFYQPFALVVPCFGEFTKYVV